MTSPFEPLCVDFFARAADLMAPDLLGRILVHERAGKRVVVRIVETEAYLGSDDPASHAYRGETRRNRTMFLAGGHLYVYLIYGLHCCLNVVCGPAGLPQAVLLRGAEVLEGQALAARRRGLTDPVRPGTLAAGPGRLAQALGLDRRSDGALLTEGPVRVLYGEPVAAAEIVRGPRVGVAYAGAAAAWPLRFAVANHAEVSRPRRGLGVAPDPFPATGRGHPPEVVG